MKKFALLLAPVLLSACATTDSGTAISTATGVAKDTGLAIFSQVVDTKCRTELNEQPLYKTASLVLSDSQKTALEDKVCGCVSQKAPESITLTDMAQAAIDSSARTKIATTAVTKTISACMGEFIK